MDKERKDAEFSSGSMTAVPLTSSFPMLSSAKRILIFCEWLSTTFARSVSNASSRDVIAVSFPK
jgi:hypothetical protein